MMGVGNPACLSNNIPSFGRVNFNLKICPKRTTTIQCHSASVCLGRGAGQDQAAAPVAAARRVLLDVVPPTPSRFGELRAFPVSCAFGLAGGQISITNHCTIPRNPHP